MPISGPVLRAKAEELAVTLGQEKWICTNSWLQHWRRRHGIVFKCMSGERASVNEETTDTWVEDVLVPTLKNCKPQDFFNADETGLFGNSCRTRPLLFRGECCRGGGGGGGGRNPRKE